MPLRRAGTVPSTGVRDGPGSAAHRHSASKTRVNALLAKGYALRCDRGKSYFFATPFAGGALTGATGFFGAGVLSTAVLISSISLATREALLPRSLSK
jgi:hypothetical protein